MYSLRRATAAEAVGLEGFGRTMGASKATHGLHFGQRAEAAISALDILLTSTPPDPLRLAAGTVIGPLAVSITRERTVPARSAANARTRPTVWPARSRTIMPFATAKLPVALAAELPRAASIPALLSVDCAAPVA